MKKDTKIKFWLMCITAILSISSILYFSLKIPALKKEVAEMHKEKAFEKIFSEELKKIDDNFNLGYSNDNEESLRLFRSDLASLAMDLNNRDLKNKEPIYFLYLYNTIIDLYVQIDALKKEEKSLKLTVKQQNKELRESCTTLRSLLPKQKIDYKKKYHSHN